MAKPPAPKRPPAKANAGRPAGLFTWLAVGLVIVVVATLVIVKVTSGSSPATSSNFQATDAATVNQVTKVPASVFDTVGISSPSAPVSAPIALKNQPALTGTSSTGATLPEVFYLGAEYCPFCAAERWPAIVALGRFGTWSRLGNTESSTHSGEIFPGTQSFTFLKSSYKSKYLVFKGIEEYNNVFNSTTGFYGPLQKLTKPESTNFKKYDTSKWIPGISASQDYSIPYMSIDNKYLISGSSFTPATLASLSRSQIASGLSDATNPVSDAIIATANYLTASICTVTKNQPGNVCNSSGVMAAKKAMGIK